MPDLMRRRVYLMRHADVSYFADPAHPVAPADVTLTAAGLEQARTAGQCLSGVQFDRVVTSGLPRTNETARIVVEQLDPAPYDPVIRAWPGLHEYEPGDADLIPDEELETSFLSVFRGTPDRGLSYLRGETVASLVDRVLRAMEQLFADPSWETILVVLHGGVNRAILSWVLAGTGPFYAQFEQSPGCINIIDGEPGDFVLRAVNLTPADLAHSGPRLTTVEAILDEYRAYRQAKR